jgi:hypothetical protein
LAPGAKVFASFCAMLFKQEATRLMISFAGSVSLLELRKCEGQKAALQLCVVCSPG